MFDGWSRSQDTLHSALFGLGILCPKVMEVENRNSSWKVTTIAGTHFISLPWLWEEGCYDPLSVFFLEQGSKFKTLVTFYEILVVSIGILYNCLWKNLYITQVGCHLQFNRNQPGVKSSLLIVRPFSASAGAPPIWIWRAGYWHVDRLNIQLDKTKVL